MPVAEEFRRAHLRAPSDIGANPGKSKYRLYDAVVVVDLDLNEMTGLPSPQPLGVKGKLAYFFPVPD